MKFLFSEQIADRNVKIFDSENNQFGFVPSQTARIKFDVESLS